MKSIKAILITLTASLFIGGPAMLYAAAGTNSGFLPDYSRLEHDPRYPDTKDWTNPDAKIGHFNAIIIDPVTVHLSPDLIKDGARPDPEVLNQVTEYFHSALTRAFKEQKMNVVDNAGDNTVRYRAAITGVSAEGGLDSNPLHYVPAVFLVRAASGKDSKKAHISMESYYTDSVTGQTLAEVMQAATGESLSGKKISMDNLKGAIDKWAQKAADGFAAAKNK